MKAKYFSRAFIIVCFTASFLMSGCSNEPKFTEVDYAKAIETEIHKIDGCVKVTFPYKHPGANYLNKMFAVLESKGIVKISGSEESRFGPVLTYELTDDGKKYYVEGCGLKFAEVKVDHIVKIEDGDQKDQRRVTFTYKLENIAPWANIPEDESPAQLFKVMAGDKRKECAAVVKIENGVLKVEKATVFDSFTEDNDKVRLQKNVKQDPI